MAYDGNLYCESTSLEKKPTSGSDVMLCIYNADGSKLLAVYGQNSLTINRDKETVDIDMKTLSASGWKNKMPGAKEWGIDTDGIYAIDEESHKMLKKAFYDDEYVCLKVVETKKKKALFGGLAILTSYPIEAAFGESVTYSASFEGTGELKDLTEVEGAIDMPEGLKTQVPGA